MVIHNNIDAHLKFQNVKVEESPYYGRGTSYYKILDELKDDTKKSRWKWFMFPVLRNEQVGGAAKMFALESLNEAKDYLNHFILGPRLIECTKAVLSHKDLRLIDIFETEEDIEKFISSMQLFAQVSDEGSLFFEVLERFGV